MHNQHHISMKRIFPIIFSILLLSIYSCQNATKDGTQKSNDGAADRLAASREAHASSTVVQVGELTDFVGTYDVTNDPDVEKEVLKGLKFGISNNQYKKIENKYLSQFEDDEIYGYHIGDFGFYNLTPYFTDDKLYRVDINGFNKLDYNEILDEIKIVKEIFSQKYGSPVYETNPPKDQELPSNEGICISEWKAGNKVIQLCFFDFSKAAHSNVLKVVIFRSDMLQENENQEMQKKKEYSNANKDMI